MSGSTRRKTAPAATKTASKRSGPNTSKEKNKGGRPPKLLPDDETLKTVESLGKIQCTTREAAAVLGVCHDTFLKFVDQHKKAAEAFERGKENGKASLRRMQFKGAENGNATMLVWLGKQILEQKDRNEHSGPGGGPIQHQVGVSWMTEEQAKARGWA